MTIKETIEILSKGDEAALRDLNVERPKTLTDLRKIIEAVTNRSHDYGTCCYAMSIAAEAAFNFVASKLDVSGFQASCADLDIIKRTRHIKGPFAIINANDLLYPQYDMGTKVSELMEKWQPWVAQECQKLLDSNKTNDHVHPNVRSHWEQMAAMTKEETA